jgi:hypothetical protein
MVYHATPGHIEDWELQETIAKLLDITGTPLALWPIQEITGTTIDDASLNGYDLTAIASVATWVTHTKRCTALQFDRVTRRLYRADAGGAFSFGDGATDDPFSVIAVIYASGASVSNSVVIAKNDPVTTKREWEFRYTATGDGSVAFQMYDESVPATIYSSIAMPAVDKPQMGHWRVYIATYDGTGTEAGVNIYENGVLVAQCKIVTGAYVAMENLGVDLTVGSNAVGGEMWEGNILFAGVCSKELSVDEAWSITTMLRGIMGM